MKIFNSIRLNQKGFLGAIGDDLPSLIPLTFALLIFFTALGFTFNEFQAKQTGFDQQLIKLRIGSTLKGDSLLNGVSAFEEACRTLSITAFKFRARVYLADSVTHRFKNIRVYEDADDPDPAQILEQNGRRFLCENTDQPLYFESLAQQKPEHLSYPVAVNLETSINPGLLVVSVWR